MNILSHFSAPQNIYFIKDALSTQKPTKPSLYKTVSNDHKSSLFWGRNKRKAAAEKFVKRQRIIKAIHLAANESNTFRYGFMNGFSERSGWLVQWAISFAHLLIVSRAQHTVGALTQKWSQSAFTGCQKYIWIHSGQKFLLLRIISYCPM